MIPDLLAMQQAGLITQLDRHFAQAIARMAGESDGFALAAAALASDRTREGHTCVAIEQLGDPHLWGELASETTLKSESEWRRVLQRSPLVGAPEASASPLVLDTRGRLYLRRYWSFQESLASILRGRANRSAAAIDLEELARGLDRYFPAPETAPLTSSDGTRAQGEFDFEAPRHSITGELDRQRLAAALSVLQRFSVISGGPGTGKTATVSKILSLIIEQEFAADREAPRIVLTAPTGKAAKNLADSIREGVLQLPSDSRVRAAIPDGALTIHRCLGVRPGSSPSFRHHAEHRLAIDVLLVDEASMVDLALMVRLLAAVPDDARVILLGDEFQLASVEAGAVLGDICGAGSDEGYSSQFAETLSSLVGPGVPVASPTSNSDRSAIADCVARLTKSYRYKDSSGIGHLARAINRGDSAGVLSLLDDERFTDIERFDPDQRGTLHPVLRTRIVEGWGGYLAEREPGLKLEGFLRFRILSPNRRGPGGVAELNLQVEAVLRRAELIRGSADRYAGRPLLIKSNDYAVELFNGDIGITLDEEDGVVRALFSRAAGGYRSLAVSRLPEFESAFATTVHKSQGSEYLGVALVVLDRAAQRATREMLYTAVTRAKEHVALFASREAIVQIVERNAERMSGLGDALRVSTTSQTGG